MTDAGELYRALLVSDRLPTLRRLTYRCAGHRCLLLDVVETPLGIVVHQKRYKLSAARNAERSSGAGRAAHTHDGANHWKARTYFIDTSALAMTAGVRARLGIQCDHADALLMPSAFQADWQAGHTEVIVRQDGSRYAVR